MSLDLFKTIDEFCSGIRRKFETRKANRLPTDIQHSQGVIHEREDLLQELNAILRRRLAGLASILMTEENGLKRELNSKELDELQNSLVAIQILRAGELMNCQRIFLDRTSLPTHIGNHSTEFLTLGTYADDIEDLTRRIETTADELRQRRASLEAEKCAL